MSTKPVVPGTVRWAGQVLTWTVMLGAGAILLVSLVIPRVAGATPTRPSTRTGCCRCSSRDVGGTPFPTWVTSPPCSPANSAGCS